MIKTTTLPRHGRQGITVAHMKCQMLCPLGQLQTLRQGRQLVLPLALPLMEITIHISTAALCVVLVRVAVVVLVVVGHVVEVIVVVAGGGR